MKYLVSWTARDDVPFDEARNSLQVFSKWSPAEGSTFGEFLSRLDGKGGYAIVTTDNPTSVLRDASIFSKWFDFDVTPVSDILEAVQAQQQALDFLDGAQ